MPSPNTFRLFVLTDNQSIYYFNVSALNKSAPK